MAEAPSSFREIKHDSHRPHPWLQALLEGGAPFAGAPRAGRPQQHRQDDAAASHRRMVAGFAAAARTRRLPASADSPPSIRYGSVAQFRPAMDRSPLSRTDRDRTAPPCRMVGDHGVRRRQHRADIPASPCGRAGGHIAAARSEYRISTVGDRLGCQRTPSADSSRGAVPRPRPSRRSAAQPAGDGPRRRIRMDCAAGVHRQAVRLPIAAARCQRPDHSRRMRYGRGYASLGHRQRRQRVSASADAACLPRHQEGRGAAGGRASRTRTGTRSCRTASITNCGPPPASVRSSSSRPIPKQSSTR